MTNRTTAVNSARAVKLVKWEINREAVVVLHDAKGEFFVVRPGENRADRHRSRGEVDPPAAENVQSR